MKAYQRIHASVPCEEQGDEDERSCEERHPEGGLVEHVERKSGSVAIEPSALLKEAIPGPAITTGCNSDYVLTLDLHPSSRVECSSSCNQISSQSGRAAFAV
jgi:hypothetical protein